MQPWSLLRPYLRNAVLGSLAGTLVFGTLMSALGMMPMIAMLVGAENLWTGWAVHLAIGALLSVPFALALHLGRAFPAAGVGIVYGLAVWLLGPLLIMPLWLGMPGMVYNLSAAGPWWSLAGHAIYGFVAGLTCDAVRQWSPATTGKARAAA